MANGNGNGSKVESFTESVWLRLISRFAVIAAVVALPLIGWMGSRAVSTVDDISVKVDNIKDRIIETNGNVKLIQQTQEAQKTILADHEARVRQLEQRMKPVPP